MPEVATGWYASGVPGDLVGIGSFARPGKLGPFDLPRGVRRTRGRGRSSHSGDWGYPTIGGLPWLEKPPLPWWLVAVLGHLPAG